MVWGGGSVLFLPSHSTTHKTWGKSQTTLCSFRENGVRTGGNTGTRIPSVDDGISSTRDSGKSPLPLRESQIRRDSRIRLNAVLDLLKSNAIGLKDVIVLFQTWKGQDEYLLLQRTIIEPTVGGSTKWDGQYIAVKCSKRGNDVYRQRVRESLSSVLENLPDRTFFNPKERELQKKIRTHLVSVTLTHDTERCSIYEAWENIGKEFDLWLKNLSKKFGKISILRTWEAFQNGYPHVNAILLFHETDFSVFRYKSKFRVRKKAAFSQHWHSYVDVQAVSDLKSAVRYITKYITKDLFSEKATQTLAMLWVFRKRSFSVSKDFASMMRRLDNCMHNSHQVSLSGKKLTQIVWRFLGIFTKSELQITENVWTIQIPNEVVKNSPKLAAADEKSCSEGYQFLVA